MLFTSLPDTDNEKLHRAILDLAEIADSFDQLAKLARIGDLLYPLIARERKELFSAIEKTARHLAGLSPMPVNIDTTAGVTDVNDCKCDGCLAGFKRFYHDI